MKSVKPPKRRAKRPGFQYHPNSVAARMSHEELSEFARWLDGHDRDRRAMEFSARMVGDVVPPGRGTS